MDASLRNDIDALASDLAMHVWSRKATETSPAPLMGIDIEARAISKAIQMSDPVARKESAIRTRRHAPQIALCARRLALASWKSKDPELLLDALILAAFVDDGADWRDTMVMLGPFHLQAQAMPVDVPLLFRRAAAACPLPEVSNTLVTFGERNDIKPHDWETFDWTRLPRR